MLFNSFEFIFLFLPVTFFGYLLLNRFRLTTASRTWLAGCSLFFYSWWNIANLPIILCSIVFNYSVGYFLCRGVHKSRALLVLGVTCNLVGLAYYKYFNFFVANLNAIFPVHLSLLKIVLPLGISFFTFTQIAYLVDAYQGKAKENDFINYVLFVTFFPHLIAGPILHHREMMPQFASLRTKILNWNWVAQGIVLFSIGLFKKVVIADTLATWANPGFAAASLSLAGAWVTALGYTLQLYFDFSGYTDMALGIALLFGIRLPENFDSPYKATSLIDFWRRWHMTLSRFLRDYLYIPLGGNRKGKFRRYLNLFITMLLGGLWHGAGWTFIFWGLLHGLGLVANHLWRSLGLRLPKLAGWVVTFVYVVIAWVFFRAENFSQALVVLKGMVNLQQLGFYPGQVMPFLQDLFTITSPADLWQLSSFRTPVMLWGKLVGLALALAVVFLNLNSRQWKENLVPNKKWALAVTVMFLAGMLGLNRISQFLYFQF
ncbi:MAG TPA: MBOAT family protein [Bacillota bacterium]|nr:MBOAT family protein [Bacillota bacterium]